LQADLEERQDGAERGVEVLRGHLPPEGHGHPLVGVRVRGRGRGRGEG